ncbi:SAF domain-containing protein [Streptomyces chilikensis]|uniref:SAF domain-containing protein n=1 Tax=Streptomyces chilikensis TaxID=1194079 RepID=UPI001F0D3FF1|nr:SAF domain-containing protein [Streptomyces chilikensis]
MRRRPGWVWAGVGAVLVSAVGFTVIAADLSGRTDVLVLARDVPAGAALTARDLRTVKVAAEAGVVPVADTAKVLGKQARVPLVAGSLLSGRQMGEAADFPPAGWSQVPLAVEAGGSPPDLTRGKRIAVVAGPGGLPAAAGRDDEEAAGPAPVLGTVTGVQAPESTGGVRVVTVLVETSAARRAAAMEHPRIVVISAKGREAL